jgi:hypothetical protein
MTMVVATKLNNKGIHLHGDSIETAEIALGPGARLPEGTTSHNERIVPENIDSNRYRIYAEKVCKIGRLSDRIACSVSGSAELAYEILGIFYSRASAVNSLDALKTLLITIKSSIEGTEQFRDQSCHLLFVCNFDRLYACGSSFQISRDGVIDLQLKRLAAEGDTYWQITEGSGLRYMQDYFPGSVKAFVDSDIAGEGISTEMLAFDYSTWLRFKTGGLASGVGGAVFGLKMTNESCEYMKDSLFLFADYRGSLEVAVKVMYREGLFLVTDFISRSVTGMRTLEAELEFRRNPSQSAKDVTDLVREALRFQAPLTLIDARSAQAPFEPNVGIIENSNGASVGAMEFNVQFQEGLPYFPPGTELNIRSRDQDYQFTVRIP